MRNERWIKWWYVASADGVPCGLRGWERMSEDRYELTPQSDGFWNVSIVTPTIEDGSWGFHAIHTGTMFDCMVAAEKYAEDVFENG